MPVIKRRYSSPLMCMFSVHRSILLVSVHVGSLQLGDKTLRHDITFLCMVHSIVINLSIPLLLKNIVNLTLTFLNLQCWYLKITCNLCVFEVILMIFLFFFRTEQQMLNRKLSFLYCMNLLHKLNPIPIAIKP